MLGLMSKVYKIGIAKNKKQEIKEVIEVELVAGKGVVGDRNFQENNNEHNQLTLIESENIDYYNEKFGLKISYLAFRRNIVTNGIKLNDLVDKKLLIGKTKVKVIDLCRPCKSLQENLGQKNIIKEFLIRGGLRCKILNNSNIKIGDEIRVLYNEN